MSCFIGRSFSRLSHQRSWNSTSVTGIISSSKVIKRSIYENTGNDKTAAYPRITPAQVTTILAQNEATIHVNAGSIKSFQSNQLAANQPIEDRRAEAKVRHNSSMLFGVFDGHAGCACAQAISERLFPYLAIFLSNPEQLEKYRQHLKDNQKERYDSSLLSWYTHDHGYFSSDLSTNHRNSMMKLAKENMGFYADDPSVSDRITNAFMRLDQDIVTDALPTTTNTQLNYEMLQIAFSGSCGVTAYVEGTDLFVANVGDTKAVMGVLSSNDIVNAEVLTKDHNADNEKELKRLIKMHPNESATIINGGRLLGQLIPLRAFGDVRYKWPMRDLRHVLRTLNSPKSFVSEYGNHMIPPNYKTPPYLTAEPEITHHRLTPKDKFLVLASDGLWDMLSPEKVVKLVAGHMDGMQVNVDFKPPSPDITLGELNSLLIKRKMSLANRAVDSNVATHLLRNALGPEHSPVSALLTLPKDVVRYYRDDITITVVFFDTDYIFSNPSHQ